MKTAQVGLELPGNVVETLRRAVARRHAQHLVEDQFNLGEEVLSLVIRYCELPERRTLRDARAMRIVEQQSLEQSIATAKPGESGYDITSRAERLTDFKLGTS